MNTRKRCPLCNTIFEERFCPHCGLPWSRFDSEYSDISELQFCFKCNTANPAYAIYCRNCGAELTFHAKDKNKHEWVDLGLSVLWSTENIEGFYPWMDDSTILNLHSKPLDPKFCNNGKDVATSKWGKKWRTPTKQEFEELIEKCYWEKCVIPQTNKYAFKIIGQNNNYIYLPVTGYAGMLYLAPIHNGLLYKWGEDVDEIRKINAKKSEKDIFGKWHYWTSTENRLVHANCAYGFTFFCKHNEMWIESSTDKDQFKICLDRPLLKSAGYTIRPVLDKK